jgi:2-dehydro-3-deoxyphosphogluconate aldolase/(4S)-4-hydroxy-2-oxoglutarate aldolase
MPELRTPSTSSKEKALALIRETVVIPVVRVATREQAMCAVEGISAAGIGIVEITLTVPGALEIITEITRTYGERLLVGAGTVLDAENCRLAALAGAEFIVSPGFDARVIEMAHHHGKACIPGALTPTEVLAAWRAGGDLIKIFPCGSVGGPAYIRSLKGPFPQIEVVVSGGVNLENIAPFLAAGAKAVAVGELIFEAEAIRNGRTDRISENARKFVEAVRAARVSLSE